MRKRINRSIPNYVVVTLVSTVTIVLAIVGTIGYHVYSRQQWNELNSNLNLSADQLAAGIALAVWNFDSNQINKIIESAMKDQAVYGVSVQTRDKVYSFARGDEWHIREADPETFSVDDLLSTERSIAVDDEKIGVLKVYVTPHFLQRKLTETLKILVWSVILLDVFLIFSLYLLIWWRVLHPLKLIETFALSITSGRKEEADAITRPLVGEFGELRNSLEKMVVLLESRLEEARSSHDRFWKLVSGFPIALGIYLPITGQIKFVNKKFTEVLGYRPEDIPDANTWFTLAYPDEAYRQQVIESWSADIKEATQQGGEITLRRYTVTCKDGAVKTFEISGVSSEEYLMAVFNDITERTRAEESVRQYQGQLEELVRQRTEELVVARDLAEAANRAKSIFLANMSHELRTPLNSVIGFSHSMAKSADLTPRQQRNLEIINRSGTHLLTLINDILEISKIEAGKMEVSKESVDLRQMLIEVTDMLRLGAEQKGISLVVETNDLPAAVMVDAPKLRQVLLNLTANAIKFTFKGGVSVVASGHQKGGDILVEFRVSDTGLGIHPDDQQRVFEPFVQVGQEDKRSGTGLGLAISRQYVQIMGGALELQSVVGEGSIFRFSLELPISRVEPGNVVPEEAPLFNVTTEFKGYRVVVADDVFEMRLLLRELLEPLGLEILEAENGIQAKDLILATQPQLVLMDWRMPLMDGVELAKFVREDRAIIQPKIIMLTANAFKENRKEALAAGVDDFMEKPIDTEVLYRMIERHVGIHFQRGKDEKHSHESRLAELTSKDLASMSPEAKNRFVDALRELNPTKIREAVTHIRAENPDIAARLDTYIEAMQYRNLWKMFDILE